MAALSGRRIAIIGLGASGQAAARLALRHGGEVRVSDDGATPELRARARRLRALGARVRLGGHDLDRVAASRLIVASPGISPESPVLSALRGAGRRWISEPEFAFRFFQSPLIAVTGTNGKTTTSALAARMLEAAGVSVGLGGNIGGGLGPPASELALRDPAPEWLVVEMSSYQLGAASRFHPDIGVVTNLAPDHLDRYPSRAAYHADKARLFANARADSRWVLGRDVPAALPLGDDVPGTRHLFDPDESAREHAGDQDGALAAYARDGWLRFAVDGADVPVMPVADVSLAGRAGLANTMAAGLAAHLAGAPTEAIAETARTFRPLPHRLERVVERDGVLWVNDSKATNATAAASAVASFDRPIVLLAGGQDKGEDLAPLSRAIRGRVRRVIAYGEARFRLQEALGRAASVEREDGGFDAAVRAARANARLRRRCSACSRLRELRLVRRLRGAWPPLRRAREGGGLNARGDRPPSAPGLRRGGPAGRSPRIRARVGGRGHHDAHAAAALLRPGDAVQRQLLPGAAAGTSRLLFRVPAGHRGGRGTGVPARLLPGSLPRVAVAGVAHDGGGLAVAGFHHPPRHGVLRPRAERGAPGGCGWVR